MGWISRDRSAQSKTKTDTRLRWMVGAHLAWLLLVCLLGGWWGRLLLAQAATIARLGSDVEHWRRTQRMLYWESPVFFGLLLACSILIFWMYWTDVRRSKGLQAFFASVTHELRTPLTSIRLQAESISESLGESHHEAALVKRLLEDTLRLEAQVERTLELARLEGGGPVYTQSLQIKPWFERWIKTSHADYQDRVHFELDIADVWLEVDPTALQIIFKNLIENAVRHSGQEQVKIQVTIEPIASRQVRVLLRDRGQGYWGEQKSLGVLFRKGPGSPGTGVGLYLVRTLMERMKGRVSFSAVESSGRGFEVGLIFHEGRSNE